VIPEPQVIAETERWVAVAKPAGLVVHPDGKTQEPTLCDWLVARYPSIAGVGEPIVLGDGSAIEKPGIVHRLDRETSGVMVVAKTQEAFEDLKAQFKDRRTGKRYLAFAWGNMAEDERNVNMPIGRSRGDFRKKRAGAMARGELRPAETYVKVLARVREKIEGKEEHFILVSAEPKTGRTHQIRTHLAAIHHAVVGDRLYAPRRPMALGFGRVALHARELSFDDGAARQTLVAPLPEDFAAAVARFCPEAAAQA
jgi:23S rRNA pseudouridine1911/1915/1917 synthase